jgi:hypothetical protein
MVENSIIVGNVEKASVSFAFNVTRSIATDKPMLRAIIRSIRGVGIGIMNIISAESTNTDIARSPIFIFLNRVNSLMLQFSECIVS